jgi:hypothetical protein
MNSQRCCAPAASPKRARETGFGRGAFRPTCPWSFEQMIANDFWPGDEVDHADNC